MILNYDLTLSFQHRCLSSSRIFFSVSKDGCHGAGDYDDTALLLCLFESAMVRVL